MATINLGRVGYVHKGTYNPATTYQKYDVVLYNHGSYLYKGDSASSGHAPTDTAYWQAMLDSGEMNAATEAAVHAAEAAHASALELAGQVDRLTTPFSVTGDMASCLPVSDYPLGVISHIEPVQAGSGDPSPANVRPISGWNAVAVQRAGKNILRESEAERSGNAVLYATSESFAGAEGQDITVSFDLYSPDGGIVCVYAYQDAGLCIDNGYDFYPAAGAYVRYSFVTKVKRYASTMNPGNIMFYCTSGATMKIKNVQVEFGTIATDFEPYKGQTIAASLPETVYGGSYNWKNGLLKVTCALTTLTGDEEWIEATWSKHLFYINVDGGTQNKLCTHFKDLYYSNGSIIFFSPETYNFTLDSWKSYLAAQYAAGTPVQICYTIADPYSIQLTPQQILSLKGVNNLWSDTGKTTVNGPNSPQVMENRIAALEAAVANLS